MKAKATVAGVVCVAALLGGLAGEVMPQNDPAASCGVQQASIDVDMAKLPTQPVAGYNQAQLLAAAKIMAAGKAAGVSYRDQVIGIVVAMGESDLGADPTSKRPNEDVDVGLFQQRALPGWYADGATVTDNIARLNNDAYAADTFFRGHDVKVAAPGAAGAVGYHIVGLVDVKNRDAMSPSAVGHEVQGNADPNHYAKWWARAQQVAKAVATASTTPGISTLALSDTCQTPQPGVAGDSGKTGQDTYGPMWDSHGHHDGVDPLQFFWGECVSYAAWMVHTTTSYKDFENNWRGAHFGNAKEWDSAARAVGIRVDKRPAVGAIAQRTTGTYGHVAYITKVNPDGTFVINEYNWVKRHSFGSRTVKFGPAKSDFTQIIHFEAPPTQKG